MPVLLYDADCGFCRWSAALVMRWDRKGRLSAAALQDPRAERWLAGMTHEERMASWHFVEADGRVNSAGAAVAPLMRYLPGGLPIRLVATAFPRLTERLYQFVTRHRDRLGRWLGARACSVDPSSISGGGD